MGWFVLRPEPEGPLDEVELGYRLRQTARGKGHAIEGSRALPDNVFTELGADSPPGRQRDERSFGISPDPTTEEPAWY
ncbi:hypothetical protein [Streptomyces shenzhenensis]|uniref:hypothetical protein n=1 Tax=Streptomyces shenzhenensis TaxID=943815 RepID=UPI00355699A1